jgi:alanine-glyoxylate transaminase/serine-glyoxylate transaminase/serine-pyruvate transaminase
MRRAGRHFLQIPGPTNVPDRVLHAMSYPTIDHRSLEFAELVLSLLPKLAGVFGASGPVIVYSSSGSGAWEAALTNSLSPGDSILIGETGHFSTLWCDIARRLQLNPVIIPGDWRRGVDPAAIRRFLTDDRRHLIRAVCIVHNETSTGCASPIPEIRRAIDEANHPALLMVDTISSLGSMPYSAADWGVDVTVGGSQKGLMLPPGLAFNALSEKALEASKRAKLAKSYWSWQDMLEANRDGFFPYTPATNLLYGLKASLDILEEEGLDNVFARHARHAKATRAAVRHWGLELQCALPQDYSNSLSAVRMPEGVSADAFRKIVFERLNMSLGNGLARLKDRVFRIGHLGDFNDLSLLGTLAGVEMGFALAGVPHRKGGTEAAIASLASEVSSTTAADDTDERADHGASKRYLVS